MTRFIFSKYGKTKRKRITFNIDLVLLPVIKSITDQRRKVSQNDVVNTALYQLPEVQKALQEGQQLYEDDTQTNNSDRRSSEAIKAETNPGQD